MMRYATVMLALLMLIGTSGVVAAGERQEVSMIFDSRETFEAGVVDLSLDTTTIPGEVRLAPSFLVADEIGDFKDMTPEQRGTGLSDTIWAKKEFVLERADVPWAWLVIFGSPARIVVNGNMAPPMEHQPDGGWYRTQIPGEWLKKGVNEVIMWGGGGLPIEPSEAPNRSAQSWDGKRTWEYDRLGSENAIGNGEFGVRLRMGGYAAWGSMESEVVDLAALAGGIIAPDIVLHSLTLEADTETPRGTSVVIEGRLGSTPTPGDESWGPWRDARVFIGKAEEAPSPKLRYFQWKATLGSGSCRLTPVLKSVTVKAGVEVLGNQDSTGCVLRKWNNQIIVRSSVAFEYQGPSERTKFLVENWGLDKVIAPGKTELEKFILLRDWVKHRAKGWEEACDRPWNAIDILSDVPKRFGMCVHHGVVFSQCASALGWVARPLVVNHHFLAEVWSNDLGKWICMDAGPGGGVDGYRNLHYESRGEPLNAFELHGFWKLGQSELVQLVATKAVDSSAMSAGFGSLFCRFGIPFRNNHLDKAEPAEDAHGMGQYHYDGYIWWEDNLERPRSPEYSHLIARKNDYYWTLNQAELHLRQTEQPGSLVLQMATETPNFKAFQVRLDGGSWEERPSEFVWKLHEGDNTLEARPVNTFGMAGVVSQAIVNYKPSAEPSQ